MMIASPRMMQELAPLTDEELVARVVAGDTAVFELLMRRHNQRLFRVARSVVGNCDEAEDVVQEAYVRAFGELAGFEGRSSVATWLTRITLYGALRRRKRRALALRAADAMQAAADPRQPPEDRVSDRAAVGALLALALDSLPAMQRAVVMLRVVQGLGTRETAACLGLTEANVKVLLHRARHLMRERVEAESTEDLREQFAFGAERCDRVVAGVFRRLGVACEQG